MSQVQVMIHVRFAADGTVTEIGERPATVTAQSWFNSLTRFAGSSYQPLSNGRGVFRVSRADVDTLRACQPESQNHK